MRTTLAVVVAVENRAEEELTEDDVTCIGLVDGFGFVVGFVTTEKIKIVAYHIKLHKLSADKQTGIF